jgi:hypothetical protein
VNNTESSNTVNISVDGISVLLDYSEYYDEWFEAETEECRACYGTGMDSDEVYDCDICFGEGVVSVLPMPKKSSPDGLTDD